MYMGTGSTPAKLLEKAYSAVGGSMEYISINNPTWTNGTCWVLIQNYESSGEADTVRLAVALVPKTGTPNSRLPRQPLFPNCNRSI